MKLLWVGALLVTGLSFYNPKFILVFSAIIFIDLIIGSHKDLIKLVRCLNNKQQLLSLKRVNADIEKEINTCYLNVSRNSNDKSYLDLSFCLPYVILKIKDVNFNEIYTIQGQ